MTTIVPSTPTEVSMITPITSVVLRPAFVGREDLITGFLLCSAGSLESLRMAYGTTVVGWMSI